MSAPVLVTGLPRSGTSWTGKMLAASGELVYVNEPLNPQHPPGRCPGVLRRQVTHRFQYLDDSWLPAFRDTAALRYRFLAELRANRSPYDLARMARYGSAFLYGRATGRRALLDDPFAVLSARWFAERLGCRVIALLRDPVSFVASWQRLGWTVYFHELLEQPALVRDHPSVLELRRLVGSQDRIAKAAALWRFAREVLMSAPGIRVVTYESLADDPVAGFRDLYGFAGLTWSDKAERRITRACTAGESAGPGFSWAGLSKTGFRRMDSRLALRDARKGLSPEEVRRIEGLITQSPSA